MKYTIPFFEHRSIKLFEFWRVSAWCPFKRNGCFIKSNELFTNGFFVPQIGKNSWKKFSQRFTGKTPSQKITMIGIFRSAFDKVNLPTKSFKNPFKNGQLGIAALKKNFIKKIRLIFIGISKYSKAALCIDEPSQINKIRFYGQDWLNRIIEKFLIRAFYQVAVVFNMFEGIHQNLFFFNRGAIDKFDEYFRFFSLFNEERKDLLRNFKRFFSSTNKMILRFVFFVFFLGIRKSSKSSESFREKFNHITIGRGNDEIAQIFRSSSGWANLFSYVKTTVTISITRSVSKSVLIDHAAMVV